METDNRIPVDEVCSHHHIETSFLHSLCEYGLIEIIVEKEAEFIPASHLAELERMIRLHSDLQINIEGIDAITNLLQRIEALQEELNQVKNRLRFYEYSEP